MQQWRPSSAKNKVRKTNKQNICEVKIQVYKELLQQSNNKKQITWWKKGGKGLEKAFLQGRYTDVQKASEKMFSVITHYGNANQNHSEISSQTHEDGYCVTLSHLVGLFVTPWTIAHQSPLFMGILHARILEGVAMLSRWLLAKTRKLV